MKRFAWVTDIHLNFLTGGQVDAFLGELAALQLDGLLIGGDIAEAHDVADYLERIDERLAIDVYFVLGNHDYYYGSISEVRELIGRVGNQRRRLHYLSTVGSCELTPRVGLVGHDGWADARLGDYEKSLVSMYDYQLIGDLMGHDKRGRWPILKALGDLAAAHIRRALPQALARYEQVVLLTHIPPWREACWHEGQLSDDHWAPHFTCQALGAAVLEIMRDHPRQHLTVLCGHTHGAGQAQLLDNVLVLTGGAEYGQSVVQCVFEFE